MSEEKEQDPGLTESVPEEENQDPVELTDNPAPDPNADIVKEEEFPPTEGEVARAKLEALIKDITRAIAKEEIGKALGHTVE